MKCGAQCSAATPLRQPGNGKSLGSGAYRDRFFGKLLCSFSRFGLQDAQTPPSPLVGEGGWGDELTGVGFWGSPCAPSSVSGIRTPKLPLLPLWEKGVGGMRGKRRGNAANRALLLRTLPLRGGGMRGRRKRRQGATNTPGESEPSHVPCAGWSAALPLPTFTPCICNVPLL